MDAADACSGTHYEKVEGFVEGTLEGTISLLSDCSTGAWVGVIMSARLATFRAIECWNFPREKRRRKSCIHTTGS